MPFGTDFLVGLSTAARKSVIRSVIPDLFRQGYSANGALDYLKTFGTVMRRQDFLAQWREMTGLEKQYQAFRFTPKKYRVSGQLMTPTADPFGRKYKYMFRYQKIDPETGRQVNKWVSFLGDDKLTIAEAEDIMEQALFDASDETESGRSYTETPSKIELFGIYRSNI